MNTSITCKSLPKTPSPSPRASIFFDSRRVCTLCAPLHRLTGPWPEPENHTARPPHAFTSQPDFPRTPATVNTLSGSLTLATEVLSNLPSSHFHCVTLLSLRPS
jgi:hypothetical protein